MNSVEQLFGQPSRSQLHWLFMLFSLILVLLTTFLFLSIGYQVKFPDNANGNPIEAAILEKISQNFPETPQNLPDVPVQTPPANCPSPQTPQTPTKEDPLKGLHQVIYQTLREEFQADLPRWSAEIDPLSLTISFRNHLIFFQTGSASLSPPYQQILEDFFPRYVRRLQKFANAIEIISIQGHTSSEWTNSISMDEAYLNNMTLSQERTRTVLEYCLQLPEVSEYKDWLRRTLSADGLSSSRPILENHLEDTQASRRVEFRIFLK